MSQSPNPGDTGTIIAQQQTKFAAMHPYRPMKVLLSIAHFIRLYIKNFRGEKHWFEPCSETQLK